MDNEDRNTPSTSLDYLKALSKNPSLNYSEYRYLLETTGFIPLSRPPVLEQKYIPCNFFGQLSILDIANTSRHQLLTWVI